MKGYQKRGVTLISLLTLWLCFLNSAVAQSISQPLAQQADTYIPKGIRPQYTQCINQASDNEAQAQCQQIERRYQQKRLDKNNKNLTNLLTHHQRSLWLDFQKTWVSFETKVTEFQEMTFDKLSDESIKYHQAQLYRFCDRANVMALYIKLIKKQPLFLETPLDPTHYPSGIQATYFKCMNDAKEIKDKKECQSQESLYHFDRMTHGKFASPGGTDIELFTLTNIQNDSVGDAHWLWRQIINYQGPFQAELLHHRYNDLNLGMQNIIENAQRGNQFDEYLKPLAPKFYHFAYEQHKNNVVQVKNRVDPTQDTILAIILAPKMFKTNHAQEVWQLSFEIPADESIDVGDKSSKISGTIVIKNEQGELIDRIPYTFNFYIPKQPFTRFYPLKNGVIVGTHVLDVVDMNDDGWADMILPISDSDDSFQYLTEVGHVIDLPASSVYFFDVTQKKFEFQKSLSSLGELRINLSTNCLDVTKQLYDKHQQAYDTNSSYCFNKVTKAWDLQEKKNEQ